MSVKQKQDGFSVVELLITLVVIGVIFGAFMTNFVTLQSIFKIGSDVQTANTTAFNKLQEYENKPFSALPTTNPYNTLVLVEDFTTSLPTKLPGNAKSGKVYISTYPGLTLKQIIVQVQYGTTDNPRKIEYADFIQRDGVGR
jgi:prepilin-type N-terminal cleavage/methylation domain-containing protein